MRAYRHLACLFLIGAVMTGAPASASTPSFFLERVVDELHQPTDVAMAPGDITSLYIVERTTQSPTNPNAQPGRIARYDMVTQTLHTFLDLSNMGGAIQSDSGLLSMAFHPDYQTNGKFYVASLIKDGSDPWTNLLQEYKVDSNGVPVFQRTILEYRNNQSSSDPNSSTAIHSIDWIGFHPHAEPGTPERNYMYITTGDGGPQASSSFFVNKSQDLNEIYGKVLRIDISDGADAYPGDPKKNFGIPADNPTAPGKLGEVIASGFRNPWRASIDRLHGDMYIGDVGFNVTEEINFFKAEWLQDVPDYGWPKREGTVQTPGAAPGIGGPQGDSLNPIFMYHHSPGDRQSVTGGAVYRGPVQELYGKYIFADFISNRIFTFDFDRDTDPATFNGNNVTNLAEVRSQWESLIVGGGTLERIVSFYEDPSGNLYLVSFADSIDNHYLSRNEGSIYRLLLHLPGDANRDGRVDIADLSILASNWQQTGRIWEHGDFDGNGVVNIADLSILASNWQAGVPAGEQTMSLAEAMAMFDVFNGIVIPEPAGLPALVLASLLALRRRGGAPDFIRR